MIKDDESIYEIVGIKDGDVVTYESGTIRQICHDEILDIEGEIKHNNIDDVLKDMDIFSDYKHYAKKIK